MKIFGAAITVALVATVALGGPRLAAQRQQAPAARVQNVRGQTASDGTVTVTYDLVSSDANARFAITLRVSIDGSNNYNVQPSRLSGDVGPGVAPGVGKTITWNPEPEGYTFRVGSGALGLTEVPPQRARYRISIGGGASADSTAAPVTPRPADTAKPAPPARVTPTPPPATTAPPGVPASAETGTIRVTSNPAGAIVQVDGQATGVTPYSGPLPAGRHTIRILNDGYQEFTREVNIQPRDNTNVNANLTRLPNTAPAATPSAPAPRAPQTAQGGKGMNPLVWVGIAGGGAAAAVLALSGGGGDDDTYIPPPPPPPPVACTFTVSTSTVSAFGSSGGSDTVNLTVSPSGCSGSSWTVSNNNTWLSVSPSSGSGSTTITLTAVANTSNLTRSGTVTIAGRTVSVSQTGIACTFNAIFPGGDGVPANSRNTQIPGDCAVCTFRTIQITASSSACSWSVSGLPTWFGFAAGSAQSGSGNGSIRMTGTERNLTGADRTAGFTVAGQAFTVRQCRAGC